MGAIEGECSPVVIDHGWIGMGEILLSQILEELVLIYALSYYFIDTCCSH